jgi:hypothetical protein
VAPVAVECAATVDVYIYASELEEGGCVLEAVLERVLLPVADVT